MTTIITIEPLTFRVMDPMPTWCQGFAMTGATKIRLGYPASLDVNSIPDGANALETLIDITAGDIVVFGHSQGAQVVAKWLDDHADDVDAPDPADLSFVVTGNPVRALGRDPTKRNHAGVLLTPMRDDTQYTVIDIARRNDGWCNWDNWPTGPTAFSWLVLGLGMFFDHCDYTAVSVNPADPDNDVRAVVGNTTYVVAP